MPDYIEIIDSQIEPEAPVTSELMTQLRDNPLAIAQGASGAPRIQQQTYFLRANTSTQTLTITDANEWGGLTVRLASASVTGAVLLRIRASDDGGSTYSADEIINGGNVANFFGETWVNFSDLTFYRLSSAGGQNQGSIADWPAGTLTHIQLELASINAESGIIVTMHGGQAQLI